MTHSEVFGNYRIDIESGGHCRFDVQLTNSRHKHDYHEICVVLSGSGKYYHGGHMFALKTGDVFVADPGVIHEITSYETQDLALFFLTFRLTRVRDGSHSDEDRLIEKFLKKHDIVALARTSLEGYVRLIEHGDGPSGVPMRARKEAMKWMCLEMAETLSGPLDLGKDDPAPEVVLALQYIDRHLRRQVTASEVANAIGISERTLRRKFDAAGYDGIAGEVNTRRMRLAAHRLLMGFSALEVSEYLNFPDPSQFTRAFKRAFSVGPKKFQMSYLPGGVRNRTLPADEESGEAR